MTRELQRSEWKTFFDGLSRDLADWETKVQVMNDDAGAQIMSDGLPFHGLTYEDRYGNETIELTVGKGTTNHQTHNINEPLKVAFEASGVGPGGTLDIEDSSGTKTLITFIEPLAVKVKQASPT